MDAIDIYEVLVKQHERMLFAYILGLVRDPVLAEDIAQQAFVIGFRKLDTLRKKEAFAAWLRSIARHIALAEMRRRQREVAWDDATMQGMEDVFHVLDQPQEDEPWEARSHALEECFKRLPDKMREACRQHYFEGQPLREITERMKVGLDAIKKRLERARDALRMCIEQRLGLEKL